MPLPANYSGIHGEEPRRDFRNLCLAFKKKIKSSKNIDELQIEMERFVDMCKDMKWPHKPSDVFRVPDGEKATRKVYDEFKRYVDELYAKPDNANPQDLLEALAQVEQLIRSAKVN